MLFIGLNVHAKPSIDLDSPDSIKAAAHAALTRLNEQNHYGIDGGFYGSVNDDSVPMWWWMSAPVYDSLLEYSKWTGDTDSFNIDAATRLARRSLLFWRSTDCSKEF